MRWRMAQTEARQDLISEALGYLQQLPATPQAREMAGRLRTKPARLRNARIRKQLDPFQAYAELHELSTEAMRFIWHQVTGWGGISSNQFYIIDMHNLILSDAALLIL